MPTHIFTNGGPDMQVYIVDAETEVQARGKAQKHDSGVPLGTYLGTVEEVGEDGVVKLP